jgi:hypothetical protein
MLTINYFRFEKMTNIQIKKIDNETDFPTITIKFNNWLNYDHFISIFYYYYYYYYIAKSYIGTQKTNEFKFTDKVNCIYVKDIKL